MAAYHIPLFASETTVSRNVEDHSRVLTPAAPVPRTIFGRLWNWASGPQPNPSPQPPSNRLRAPHTAGVQTTGAIEKAKATLIEDTALAAVCAANSLLAADVADECTKAIFIYDGNNTASAESISVTARRTREDALAARRKIDAVYVTLSTVKAYTDLARSDVTADRNTLRTIDALRKDLANPSAHDRLDCGDCLAVQAAIEAVSCSDYNARLANMHADSATDAANKLVSMAGADALYQHPVRPLRGIQ